MMYALEECCIIMTYICTHDTEMWNGCIHKKYDVRLILAKGMVAIWHQSYHSGLKSR